MEPLRSVLERRTASMSKEDVLEVLVNYFTEKSEPSTLLAIFEEKEKEKV
jgi:hypothetical protein